MPITVSFHESQYPSRLAAQLREGLRSKKLPSKFLYDSPAQAQRWLTYHQAFSPSRTEPELLALYAQSFQVALHALSSDTLHYVSLGCGGGKKDALFLQHAMPRCASLLFTPTDTSAALVLETMLHIQDAWPALISQPLVVDLDMEPDLASFLSHGETPDSQRLFSCFGMIPNFNYRTFLPYLRRLMRPLDVLLISANLSPIPYPEATTRIMPQYDNEPARAWFGGLLDSLGFSALDVDVSIRAHPLRLDGHVWQIRVEAICQRQIQLTLDEESFVFYPDELLQLFFSNRFTPQVMPQILADAGLDVVSTFLFDSQEEAIYLCRRST